MISFFRRIQSTWLVLGLFGLILIAFMVTGVNIPGGGGIGNLAPTGTTVAQIGRSQIDTKELLQRTQAQFESAKQERPELDIATFVRGGGIEQVVDQMINARALERFANTTGVYASKRLIDGEIASIAAFRGPTGEFDRATFLGILDRQRLTERGVREDIGREKLSAMLIGPVGAIPRVPLGLAAPIASLLLETRQGQITVVPNSAMPAGAAPTDAELTAYYKQNAARYTVSETRTLRYALFDRARFDGKAAPTEADIAAAYKANATAYAGKETRVFTQIITPDQTSALAIATKIKGGTAIDAAAKSAGVDATLLSAQDKTAYAGLSSAAIADAAFATKQGEITQPAKSGLGWHIVRVDKINRIAGKTLADVRATLVADLTRTKTDGMIAEFVTKIENEIADGSTFDDVVKAEGLPVSTTPAITANGAAPTDPAFKAPADFAPILRDAFSAELDDDASVISLSAGKSYVLYDLDRIVPAAPRPFAQVRGQLTTSFLQDRARKAARALATGIVAKINKGTAMAQAISATGVNVSAPRPIGAQRLQLTQNQTPVPPPLQLLFQLNRKQARILETSDRMGWYVISLDQIIPGNAATKPGLTELTQQQMARIVGDEYVGQFAAAIRQSVSATRNPAAIAKAKRDLTGASAQ